ncbi:MAG TPA: ribonuclease domain-containing protein [Dissulfurispiraceae bacterium]|nr:ribonuclease domain-containing protein [Dissulfurispiraceae bacterium]
MSRFIAIGIAVVLCIIGFGLFSQAYAMSCEKVVSEIDSQLQSKIDRQELTEILRHLNDTNNRQLPAKFISKREARSHGWRAGQDLWRIDGLKGSSIGGDQFKNLEGKLPPNKWREADLDYKGGHRGGKRLIFSRNGLRFVTADHYRTFVEIPACQ